MPDYNDPTILHPAECTRCGTHYADGDVLEDELCPQCKEELEADDDED